MSQPNRLLNNRAFTRLWAAHIASGAGTAITTVALPLAAVLVLEATPPQMGLLAAAASLPNLLFGLVAGVWVDRFRRRPILVWADVGRALLLASIPAAAWLGQLSFLHLWIVTFAAGVAVRLLPDRGHLPPARPGAEARSGRGQQQTFDQRRVARDRGAGRGWRPGATPGRSQSHSHRRRLILAVRSGAQRSF